MLKNLILLPWFVFHLVHVSLTSVDYEPENGCFKVFIKLYLNDFLLDAKLNEDEFLFSDKSKSEKIIEDYINRKFTIEADDKTLTGKVNNFEVSDDEVTIYMEHKISGIPNELLVRNLIMTELNNDQTNLVIIKIDNFEEGFKFTSEITEHIFKIKN